MPLFKKPQAVNIYFAKNKLTKQLSHSEKVVLFIILTQV